MVKTYLHLVSPKAEPDSRIWAQICSLDNDSPKKEMELEIQES